MTQISDRPETQHADQTGSHDGTEPEVLMDEAEAKELAAAMQEAFLMIEFYTWRARRLANRQDKKYQARERIRQVRENGYRQGRGKYIFVISRPTFLRIIKYIRSLNTRSSREVCRIMIMMYKYGKDFSRTGPKWTAGRLAVTSWRHSRLLGYQQAFGKSQVSGVWGPLTISSGTRRSLE